MSALLGARGISKSFGGRRALEDVDLNLEEGEVHALLGENGAGKTTLARILGGSLRPDAGQIRFHGNRFSPRSPGEAIRAGIGSVHQHFTLADGLAVWENVWLAHPERPSFRLRSSEGRRAARALAERFRLRLDPDARTGTLPVGQRQRVEIAKALARRCRLVLLDEPTAVLTPAESRDLLEVVGTLCAGGTAVLFITHKIPEALAVATSLTVLRGGRVVHRGPAAEASAAGLARAIVGEERGAAAPAGDRPGADPGPVLLEMRGVRSGEGRIPVRDVSFALRAGEILGVAGVDGNGQDEIVALLVGLVRPASGAIRIGDRDVNSLGPRARWRMGLSVLPGDRERNGLLLEASLWENLALREFGEPWARPGRLGLVSPALHRRRAVGLLHEHGVRAAGPDTQAFSLSGGNRQKLLLARELASDPRVLVLQNPTRGLDVGAARDLHEELAVLARNGRAALLFSTDLDEVVACADRWAALHAGVLRESGSPDRERLGSMMLGAPG